MTTFLIIAKKSIRIHKVILEYLPDNQTSEIFGGIFNNFQSHYNIIFENSAVKQKNLIICGDTGLSVMQIPNVNGMIIIALE